MKSLLYTLLTLLLSLTFVSCGGTTIMNGVPNFYQVDPTVWRSGQITTPEGWAYIKSLGITDVVKLDFDSEGSDQGAIDIGLTVHYFPIQPNGDVLNTFVEPDANMIAQAETVIGSGRKVLVHCLRGQDRTGLTIGIHRVEHDHWAKDQAWGEMLQRGFHIEMFGLVVYWSDDVN